MASVSGPRSHEYQVRVHLAVIVGFVLLVCGTGVALAHARPEAVGRNAASATDEVIRTAGSVRVCQAGERVPRRTQAVYLALSTESIGPRVTVEIFSGGHLLRKGSKAPGWRGTGITVPIEAIARGLDSATVCIAAGEHRELLTVYGVQTSARAGAYGPGGRLSAKAKIEFLRPGRRLWWALIVPVARRLGLGHAAAGTWLAGALFIAMSVAIILGSWLAACELSGRA